MLPPPLIIDVPHQMKQSLHRFRGSTGVFHHRPQRVNPPSVSHSVRKARQVLVT